jgi:tRNA U34 2-thiouridine synthase MnmA/TrmU
MENKKRHIALALFSGGLDSLLVVKLVEQQGIKVIPVCFESPFFSCKKAIQMGKKNKIFVNVVQLEHDYLEMIHDPKHGYGKNMNPCIDCHAFMYKKLGDMLEKYNADFLISGEVLGQRPMSQHMNGLNAVAKWSGYKDLIVRPLSQKLLPDTKPIREGWIDKNLLLDLQGRNRIPQIELAEKFGISEYPTPAGGCLLTDPGYSKRLFDLKKYNMFAQRFITFLNVGRQFRLDYSTKLIIGRNQNDNEYMEKLIEKSADKKNIVLKAKEIPGPIGIVQTRDKIVSEETLKLAAEILVRYTSKVNNEADVLMQFPDGEVKEMLVEKRLDGFERELLIN